MAETKHSKRKQIGIFLKSKYRLILLNDTTFGEKFSWRLSPANLLIGFMAITIVMTTLVISLVAFTPLREYIPGYGDVTERKQILQLNLKADSLEQIIETRDHYLNSVLNVMNERVETKSDKPRKDTTGKFAKVNTNPSESDIEFRTDYERNKNAAMSGLSSFKPSALSELVFFTPVSGIVSSSFNLADEHYGVDVVTRPEEIIKSTLDGTVIFTGFSAGDGNIIHVQHSNNLVSIYKHCSALLKSTGERVKSGEAISVVGNSGEKSHGPHLHFELWYNGAPINPQEFVSF